MYEFGLILNRDKSNIEEQIDSSYDTAAKGDEEQHKVLLIYGCQTVFDGFFSECHWCAGEVEGELIVQCYPKLFKMIFHLDVNEDRMLS